MPSANALAVLLAACGLGLCAWCEDLSRATLAPNPWIYWAGIILIVAPLTHRATAPRASTLTRVALVALVGLSLYLAQLMRDPFGFAITDEFPHGLNLQQIIESHHLFHANPLLPITPHFPGLEGAASALASLTGMSSWGSALLFIGAVRVGVMLALFVLLQSSTRSARAAALGAIVFAANSNFMVFEGQFSYESLSLPLVIVAFAALAERQRTSNPETATAWGMVLVVMTLAIVPTHHLTSYLLVLVLWLACVRRVWLPPPVGWITVRTGPRVLPYAIFATVITVLWLVLAATQVIGYLTPEVNSALQGAINILAGGTVHAPFSGTATAGSQNTLTEELASFAEPVLLLLAIPFGLRTLWSREFVEPLRWVLGVAAMLFFVDVVFKFVPNVWEISNRAGEFLFLGVSFIVGCTALRWTRQVWHRPARRALVCLALALAVVGGAVSGQQASARLARPTRVDVHGRAIWSETEAVGRWFASQPPGAVLANDADAQTINLYGNHSAFSGDEAGADDVLDSPKVAPWMQKSLDLYDIRYIVADRRERSKDIVQGTFFNMQPPIAPIDKLYSPKVLSKWKRYGARVYDSGDIVVYDLHQAP